MTKIEEFTGPGPFWSVPDGKRLIVSWPGHESMMISGHELCAEVWPDDRLRNCFVDGRKVTEAKYRKIRDQIVKA